MEASVEATVLEAGGSTQAIMEVTVLEAGGSTQAIMEVTIYTLVFKKYSCK